MYPRHAQLRSQLWRPKNLLGYRVSDSMPDPEWTLRANVLETFRSISENAWPTDEETFVNLIIGLARAGDVPGVESILKSVWNIDVNALDSFDEEEIQSPTYYSDNHPLRPTHNLLFAIVHAYSLNSDTPKALSLLDYTSRNYALEIPAYVWEELLEWTFVLSKSRQKKSRKQGQAEGLISRAEVESLYNKIIDQPYNMEPTFPMLKVLAKSFRQQRRLLNKSLSTVRQVESDLHQHISKLKLMIDTAKSTILSQPRITTGGIPSKGFFEFRREFQLTFLSVLAQHGFLLQEVNRILTESNWPGTGKQNDWPRRWLPDVVEEFQSYLPRFFRYQSRTGQVTLECPKELRLEDPVRSLLAEAAVIFRAMAPFDLFQLEKRLNHLSQNFESEIAQQLETDVENDDTFDSLEESSEPQSIEQEGLDHRGIAK